MVKYTWEFLEDVQGKGFSRSCSATFSLVGIAEQTNKVLSIIRVLPKYLNRVEWSPGQDRVLRTEVEMTRSNGGGECGPPTVSKT